MQKNQPDPVSGHKFMRSITGLGTSTLQGPFDDGNMEFQRAVLKQFAIIKKKLDVITSNQDEVSDRWGRDNENAQGEAMVPAVENVEKVMAALPISNNAELNDVEKAIVDADCYKKMAKELAKIGGNSLKSVVLNLVKRLFTDKVAQEYSWEGKKKKRRICDLKLCVAILDATRVLHENATDCEISQIVKDWLRHAAERAKNKKGPPANKPTNP